MQKVEEGITIAVLGSIWKVVWSVCRMGYTSGDRLRHLLFVDGMIERSLLMGGDSNNLGIFDWSW